MITGMLYEMVEDCVQPYAQERASVQGKCLWTYKGKQTKCAFY